MKIPTIFEKELLQKVKDGVSKTAIWQKPLLLLTQNGSDYTYIMDMINEAYNVKNINTDPSHFVFVRENGKLESSLNGVIINYHSDADIYEYLGGPLAYDEKIHRFCVDLVEYEGKPVISLMCISDKNCSVENIPEWMHEKFEIALLSLDFSSYGKD